MDPITSVNVNTNPYNSQNVNNTTTNTNTNTNTNANTNLTPHETLELRELLNTEIVGIKKLKASMAMITDEELKSYMQRCLDSKKNKLQSIQQFIENTVNTQ